MAGDQLRHTPMGGPGARRRKAGTSRRQGAGPPSNRAFVASDQHGRSRRPGLDRSEAAILLRLTRPCDTAGHGSWAVFGLRPPVKTRSRRGAFVMK